MRLKNRKTGEIKECIVVPIDDNGYPNEYEVFPKGDSLAELNAEWEDYYEEPKEFWYIGQDGVIFSDIDTITQDYADRLEAIGNYFETEEEAEKAVEKLKAWKRLKDKGFRFEGIKEDWTRLGHTIPFRDGRRYLQFNKAEDNEWLHENWKDLFMLFGGEE